MAHSHGEVVKARRWAEKAVAEDPSHTDALALLQRLDASGTSLRARTR
jgi:hypothetical protein